MEKITTCCDGIGECLSTDLFKALSDPNRVSILIRLAESGMPQTVTEVSNCCPVNMSVVSRHLKILREAGVLSSEKQGKEVYYTVRTDDLVKSLRTLANAIETCCPDGTCRISGGVEND
jgi:DNA-binding transcriptional ArsR family regulator